MRRSFMALAVTACIACSAFGASGTGGSLAPPTASDGGTPEAAPGEEDGAIGEASATPLLECPTGTQPVFGRVAFDATPAGAGAACDYEEVLALDGKVAGLDGVGANEKTIAAQPVNGCVGIDLGPPVRLRSIVVRLGALDNACNNRACDPVSAEGCVSGRSALVFGGLVSSDLRLLGKGPIVFGTPLADVHVIEDLNASDLRIIVVCRSSWKETRSDVAVDVIYGCQ